MTLLKVKLNAIQVKLLHNQDHYHVSTLCCLSDLKAQKPYQVHYYSRMLILCLYFKFNFPQQGVEWRAWRGVGV